MEMLELPRRALVVGLGASGLAAVRLLVDRGVSVTATDSRSEQDLSERLDELPGDVRTVLGGHPTELVDETGMVVVSPGVPPDLPLLAAARQRGVPVLAEVELAWSQRPEAVLVAVTGSNGKSTVTTMIAKVLERAGRPTVAGGNLGTPASRLVLEGGWDHWVLEISSFQAEALTSMRPKVGVILNLSQDHLERHADFEEYAAAKYRLFARQTSADWAVLNRDDGMAAAAPTFARRLFFSLREPADGALRGGELLIAGEPLMPAEELGVGGRHNLANALAAGLAAHALDVDRMAIRKALAGFEGLPHRHRVVAEVNDVAWVDDSKATNVGATAAALAGYPDATVHLILGGLGKGQDFTALADQVRRAVVCVYLIGRDAELIGQALDGAAPTEMCGTLEEAVRRSRGAARSGQTVLLAPACASFDQFADYARRGEAFSRLVREEVVPCR